VVGGLVNIVRLQLAAVPRKDDHEDFDDWSDQLAAKLQKRGRPEEALPLLSELGIRPLGSRQQRRLGGAERTPRRPRTPWRTREVCL
jgi:hypothetical protein